MSRSRVGNTATHLSQALAGLLRGLQRGGDVARAQAVVDHGPDGDAVDETVLQARVGAGGDLDIEEALDEVVRAREAAQLGLLQVAVHRRLDELLEGAFQVPLGP